MRAPFAQDRLIAGAPLGRPLPASGRPVSNREIHGAPVARKKA